MTFVMLSRLLEQMDAAKPIELDLLPPTPFAYEWMMREQVRKKSEAEVAHLFRVFAKSDLFFLLRYVCKLSYLHDQWWVDRCREVQAQPDGMIDLWARGHGKSTVITFGKTIQDILTSHGDDPDPKWNGVELTFGIFSHNRPISKAFLRQIKVEFETNELLKSLFTDVLYNEPLKESPKWSENDGITVIRNSNPKEATVEAYGLVDGMPTGKHFHVRVYDDVVTETSVTTHDQQVKTTRAWELSSSLGMPDGVVRIIGTRYDLFDTYATMIERGAATERRHAATDNGRVDGKPVFLSQTAWEKHVREDSPYILSCQQLLNPTPDENAYFRMAETVDKDGRPPTINWYDSSRQLRYVRNYGASDCATKDGAGDYTALGIISIDGKDNWYLRDIWCEQKTSDIWIDQQLSMARQWRPSRFVGEGGVIENVVGPARRKRIKELKAYGWCGGYVTVPRVSDKPTHAIPFQGRWNTGRIFLPRDAKTGESPSWVQSLLLEMRNFPRPPDDQVDMLANLGRALDDLWKGTHPTGEEQPVMRKDSEGNVTVNEKFIKDQIRQIGREVVGRFD